MKLFRYFFFMNTCELGVHGIAVGKMKVHRKCLDAAVLVAADIASQL